MNEGKERNMIIASNIKKFLKENQMTQKELAEKIGISPSTMSDYMNLRSNPSHGVIQKISDVFNVGKSDIDTTFKDKTKNDILSIYSKLEEPRQKKVYDYAEKQLDEQENNVVDLFSENPYIVSEPESEYYVHRKKHEVKINGLLTAGGGTENFDKFIPIDTEYLERVPNDYDLAFRVKGDSMYPAFENDEVIFVRNTDDYYNGMFAAVEIDGEAYIKKIYIEDNRIRLVSLNDDVNKKGDRLYPDFYADEKNDIRLIGKVL